MKTVNLETITDTQSWYTIQPLDGFNPIRVKRKLLRRRKGVYESFSSRRKSLKSLNQYNSLEFGKSCEDLSWNHRTSTPHRSETNSIAERAVRRIKEGSSAVLLQSGLDERWWSDSMECCCYLRNVQDLLADGKTPYESRFGVIPFGSMVEYHPISAKDQSRLHQFGKKISPGIFLGYALYAEGIWKGDILVADIEVLENLDTTKIHAPKTQCKGSGNAKEL